MEFTLRFVPSPGEEEPSDGEALVELSVCSVNIVHKSRKSILILLCAG